MGHTSSYCVLSIPIGRYLIKSYLTQPGQPLEPRFSDLYNYLGVCVSSTQTPQVISRIVRTHMTNIDPVSVSSDGEVYAVSSSSGRAAARVISVMSSSASWPETIEHIESSGFDRQDPLALHEAREEDARTAPAGFEQEDSLALREAREEAARKALEVSAARLRHQELELEATTARLQLLEVRERRHRAAPASSAARQGAAPTRPAASTRERPVIRSENSLVHPLGQRRVWKDRLHELGFRRFERSCDHVSLDQLSHLGADHVGPEELARLRSERLKDARSAKKAKPVQKKKTKKEASASSPSFSAIIAAVVRMM